MEEKSIFICKLPLPEMAKETNTEKYEIVETTAAGWKVKNESGREFYVSREKCKNLLPF